GDACLHAGELEGAREALGEAKALFEERDPAGAARLASLQNLVMTLGEPGQTHHRMGEYATAEAVLREAIVHAKAILDAQPHALPARGALVALQSDLGLALEQLGRFDDAERELRAADAGARTLATAHPDQRSLRR